MNHTWPETGVRATQLLDKAIAGDPRAFGQLYQQHLDGIYRYFFLQSGNEAQAEALTEKTFVRVWHLLPNYTSGTSSFHSWLFWVARQVLISRQRRQSLSLPAGANGYQIEEDTTAGQEELVDALHILSEMEKQVILLRLVEGLTYREVSQIIRRSEGACQLMQQWAMNALHHHILYKRQAPRLQGPPEGREEVLSMCMEQLVPGYLTLEECISMFPRWEKEITALMPLVHVFHRAHAVHPTDFFVVASRHRLEQQLPRRVVRRPPEPAEATRSITPSRAVANGRRTFWPVAFASLAVLLLFALATGAGIVRAADGAAPGDLLYGLDRMLETRALSRETNPTIATLQQLRNAQERIDEIETLSARGDSDRVDEALREYAAQIGLLLEEGEAAPGDEMALTQLIDEALAAQGARIDVLLMPDAGVGLEIASLAGCAPESVVQLQPATRTVAGLYQVSQGDVASWRCAGYDFGEILLALETSRRTAIPVEELLVQQEVVAGWGHLWQALKDAPPGQEQEPPGQEQEPPGQEDIPPGQEKDPSGQLGEPPGQDKDDMPGNAKQPPGQEKEPPGQTNTPPGQEKEPPGQVNEPPGQVNEPPGQSNEPPPQSSQPPGQSNEPPPQSNQPPGQEKTPPGQSDK